MVTTNDILNFAFAHKVFTCKELIANLKSEDQIGSPGTLSEQLNHLLTLEGEPVIVNVQRKADLLSDKLTAFVPNTTGIPYFKGEKDCSMEIIKQLFDIASLFDVTNDLTVVAEAFR